MLKRFATAAVFILAVCVLGAKPTPAAQYKLKMQTYYSPTTAMGAKYFAEQVNKLTGGRVEIQVFTGGELVGSANILKAVLYERRGLKKLFGDDYAKLGVVYLGPTWAAPYHTLSKQPIRSLDEMRKMKIRAVGATAKMLSAVGVNVVNLPPEDIYMALTTGQIDGVVYGSAAEYKETKFYEVAGWLNVTPLIDPITDTLIINKKLWESLPEDIRAAFQAAADQTRWSYYIWSEGESLKVMKELFKDKMTTFPEADQKILVKAAEQIWEEEALKSPDARQGVDILKEFAKSKGRL